LRALKSKPNNNSQSSVSKKAALAVHCKERLFVFYRTAMKQNYSLMHSIFHKKMPSTGGTELRARKTRIKGLTF